MKKVIMFFIGCAVVGSTLGALSYGIEQAVQARLGIKSFLEHKGLK